LADDGLIQPNAAVEEYIVRARQAHANLRKHWDNWIQIGRSLHAFNLQLDEAIIPNEGRPEDTQRWRDSMGAFLRREGWHESQPTGFSKSERINLLHCMSRLDEIEAYRMRFGEVKGQNKLTRHNNPNQVWRSFLKDIGELKTKEGGKKSTLSESVVELQEELDDLREENAHLKEEFAGDDWEEKLKAIVIKNDAEALASAIWDADADTRIGGVRRSGRNCRTPLFRIGLL
jgi:FtsZ-binding cell division protein ZapB